MITYTYRCKDCGYKFDKVQRITDEFLKTCPQCGKDSLEIVISGGSGFILRGSDWVGFYKRFNDKERETCCSRGISCEHPKRCCEKR